MEKYDITDYLKDDKELQKAVIDEFLKEIAELKAENEKLKALCDTYKTCYQAKHSDIKCLFIKYKQTLQEIKKYLNTLSGIDNDFVNTETYLRIIDLITKTEEE